MARVEQPIYCITEQQRNALLKYLLDRPYREVAVAVQFLTNAPNAVVNVEVPDEVAAKKPDEQEPKLKEEQEQKHEFMHENLVDEDSLLARV